MSINYLSVQASMSGTSGYHENLILPQEIVHMKPLNPRNPPLPLTLSDAPSSVVFFSLGLSLMF